MAYKQRIKNFEGIRDYIREFYIYGFRTREGYGQKSGRTYDNERRRIESYLGKYMCFQQGKSGKRVFLSVDSREVETNPLFLPWKAKSFTDLDITLYFLIMDGITSEDGASVNQMMERMQEQYVHKLSY